MSRRRLAVVLAVGGLLGLLVEYYRGRPASRQASTAPLHHGGGNTEERSLLRPPGDHPRFENNGDATPAEVPAIPVGASAPQLVHLAPDAAVLACDVSHLPVVWEAIEWLPRQGRSVLPNEYRQIPEIDITLRSGSIHHDVLTVLVPVSGGREEFFDWAIGVFAVEWGGSCPGCTVGCSSVEVLEPTWLVHTAVADPAHYADVMGCASRTLETAGKEQWMVSRDWPCRLWFETDDDFTTLDSPVTTITPDMEMPVFLPYE